MSRGRRKDDDAVIGCLAYVLLAVFFMPIVGLVMVCSKDPEKKTWGWILLIAGIILWLFIGLGGA